MTVAGPWPRIRTERTPVNRTGSRSAYCPGPRQTVPPVWLALFTASWIVNEPLACDSAVTQAVQLQSWPSPAGRPGMAAIGDGAGVDIPDAEPSKMMMHAARRRAVEKLDRGVGGARREHPVVAGLESPWRRSSRN